MRHGTCTKTVDDKNARRTTFLKYPQTNYNLWSSFKYKQNSQNINK